MTDYDIKLLDPADAPVLDVPEVVALERAIAERGTDLATLMERAGTSVAQYIQSRWKPHCKMVVLCGSGNNGGDGWVIGRQLAAAGYPVKLVALCEPDDITAHPAREAALRAMAEVGSLPKFELAVSPESREVEKWMANADVVVDALLGTGFAHNAIREPAAGYAKELRAIVDDRNCCMGATQPAIVAVDVPSGLNAQTGDVAKPCVAADVTITMITGKPGVVAESSKHLVGQLFVAEIADICGLV